MGRVSVWPSPFRSVLPGLISPCRGCIITEEFQSTPSGALGAHEGRGFIEHVVAAVLYGVAVMVCSRVSGADP